MIEINLVPDVKQELIRAQKVRSTVISIAIIIALASVGVVVALAIYIFGVQAVRDGIDNKAIDDKYHTLHNKADLGKILTIQNQLTKISSLNANKKVDSRIFDVLGAVIPPSPNDIKVSDLTIDSDAQTITINGQAANSYAAVEVFRKTIAGAQIQFKDSDNNSQQVALASNVSISNTSYGEDTTGAKVLRFTISFSYAQELFLPSSKDLTIKITVNGNVTDSYLGIPKTIFTAPATDITGGQ